MRGEKLLFFVFILLSTFFISGCLDTTEELGVTTEVLDKYFFVNGYVADDLWKDTRVVLSVLNGNKVVATFETTTDEKGSYLVKIPVEYRGFTIKVDAYKDSMKMEAVDVLDDTLKDRLLNVTPFASLAASLWKKGLSPRDASKKVEELAAKFNVEVDLDSSTLDEDGLREALLAFAKELGFEVSSENEIIRSFDAMAKCVSTEEDDVKLEMNYNNLLAAGVGLDLKRYKYQAAKTQGIVFSGDFDWSLQEGIAFTNLNENGLTSTEVEYESFKEEKPDICVLNNGLVGVGVDGKIYGLGVESSYGDAGSLKIVLKSSEMSEESVGLGIYDGRIVISREEGITSDENISTLVVGKFNPKMENFIKEMIKGASLEIHLDGSYTYQIGDIEGSGEVSGVNVKEVILNIMKRFGIELPDDLNKELEEFDTSFVRSLEEMGEDKSFVKLLKSIFKDSYLKLHDGDVAEVKALVIENEDNDDSNIAGDNSYNQILEGEIEN